jgi:multisubunit Na+/H+ antiporter MnhG subunit
VTTALVVAGVAVLVLACVGVLAMPEALARLHYVSLGSLATVLVVAAVVVDDGASLITVKALTLAVLVLATSPVLAHVGGRALHQRRERRR